MKVKLVSCVRLLATPWTAAYQAPPSMGFSRQEYWSGLPCAPPGDLPNPGIKPTSLKSPALAVGFFTPSVSLEAGINSKLLVSYEEEIWKQICLKGQHEATWKREPFTREGERPQEKLTHFILLSQISTFLYLINCNLLLQLLSRFSHV